VEAVVTTIIRRADLGPRRLIKSGGFGDVYRVNGSGQPVAHKEFTSELATRPAPPGWRWSCETT
jgi:hypothetical protein